MIADETEYYDLYIQVVAFSNELHSGILSSLITLREENPCLEQAISHDAPKDSIAEFVLSRDGSQRQIWIHTLMLEYTPWIFRIDSFLRTSLDTLIQILTT